MIFRHIKIPGNGTCGHYGTWKKAPNSVSSSGVLAFSTGDFTMLFYPSDQVSGFFSGFGHFFSLTTRLKQQIGFDCANLFRF